MSVKRTDHTRQFNAALDRAARFAIEATGTRLLRNLEGAFGNHYTSGAFRDSLKVRAALRRTVPFRGPDNQWTTRVGIKANERNQSRKPDEKVIYGVGEIALAWELGHENVFLRRRVRVQIWEPTANESREDMQQTFARVFKRYIETGAK